MHGGDHERDDHELDGADLRPAGLLTVCHTVIILGRVTVGVRI